MSYADVEALIEREVPKLPGWFSFKKSKRMAELARGTSLCVELGVYGGQGLATIALTLVDQGFGRVDGIDPFMSSAALEGTNDSRNSEWWGQLDYESVARAAQAGLYRLGLMPYAHLIRMLSREAVEFYGTKTVDLIHQDSNHSTEISLEEVELWAPKIRPGGYWIFDDTDWTSTRKAQRALSTLGFTEPEDHGTWKVYRRPI